ncbi:hypothetical protein BamMEX5DRAFT_1563 [Burkholderia ambifaria MEX-5]|uniref:Uncharacterized protein n=1 Tax=Burkholderia ambifaria MEX-5 TaxID=396597 RepID=B1T197_9BURK|nr:hypothetical protein BamMEX5DRAFT_1563 [Burkholderia ambifaria MEX-5]
MLTIEFHSVSTGLGLGLSTRESAPSFDVVPLLTVGIHSVWSCRGSRDLHPNRRGPLIVCRHSPSKFTAFGVVVERAIHTRIGTLVRARAVTHHRNSQCFESSWGGLSTPESAPSFERCRCSLSEFTAFRVVARRAVHIRIGTVVRARVGAHRWNSQGFECLWAAISTPLPASRSTAQRRAPRPDADVDILPPNRLTTLWIRKVSATVAAARHGSGGGYLLSASTRRAVDFNGERRHPLQLWTDRGVDIRRPTRLETLCDRTVSTITHSAGSPGIVDIPRPQPIRTLCIPSVSTAPFPGRNPCRTDRERPPPRPRPASRSSSAISTQAPTHPGHPDSCLPPHAKTLSIPARNLRSFSHFGTRRAR